MRRDSYQPSGFGPALRRLRAAAGLSLRQLGGLAGIHWNLIAKYERGEAEPTWPTVLALAASLGVDCTAFAPAAGPKPGPAQAKKPVAARTRKRRGGRAKAEGAE